MQLVVVGAGIVGSACAYAASALGAEVTLVDAERAGRATSAGAGIVSPWWSRSDDADRYAFSCAAAAAYPAVIDALADLGETATGYRRVGGMVVTDTADRAAEIHGQLAARRPEWPEMGGVEIVDRASQLFPPLRADLHGVFLSGGARVDGRLMAAALTRAAERTGTVVMAGDAELRCERDRVDGVSVGGEPIGADAVVAATGAWTDEFLRPSGLTLGVAPQRGQIVHIRLDGADTGWWPTVSPDGSSHYLLAFDDSRVVVGATREAGSGFDYRATPGGLADVLTRALHVAPGLASGTYLETRIGFRPMGPGVRPLLGPVPGLEGLIVATGLGASGLTMGPYAGEIAARLALGLAVPLDLSAFAPPRTVI